MWSAKLSGVTHAIGSSLAGWNAKTRFGENPVNNFLRTVVVFRMEGAAPARKFATQEFGPAPGGAVLMLSMKGLQEGRALLDETINSLCVCRKMHGYSPSQSTTCRDQSRH